MNHFVMTSIGRIANNKNETAVHLEEKYIPALTGIDGFSHLQIIWWFSDSDTPENRHSLIEKSPYKKAPAILGTFATRSPNRPNPIALSTAAITFIDYEKGIIGLAYIDADNNTPVLDIKPYTPSLDRIENPSVPDWCAHWPKSNEESARFDWENEFTF